MAETRSVERRVLSNDQFELVESTHHPAIYKLDGKELREVQKQLRDQRGKVRTQVRQRQREARGKSDSRGKSFPGGTEQPLMQKQIIAKALKRVNKELDRQQKLEARTAHVEAARRALAMHRQAQFENPAASDRTPDKGMRPIPNRRRRSHIPGSQIGSVSQATRVNQAIKDNRGA
jgi:hypothetical protein